MTYFGGDRGEFILDFDHLLPDDILDDDTEIELDLNGSEQANQQHEPNIGNINQPESEIENDSESIPLLPIRLPESEVCSSVGERNAEQHQSSMADVSEAEWADVIPDEDLADMYMEHDDNTASVMDSEDDLDQMATDGELQEASVNTDDRLTQPYGDNGMTPHSPSVHQANSDDSDSDYRPSQVDSEVEEQEAPIPIPTRFVPMEDDEVLNYIEQQKNPNTRRKTSGNVRLLTEFLESKGEYRRPNEIAPEILDKHLALFFVTVRKDDEKNQDYEPSTLKGIQSSIERFLKEKRYQSSIINSPEFFTSREAIRSRCIELKKLGKGNRPNKKRSPTLVELEQMWETGALGASNPRSLQYTVWWVICTRFGRRANEENRALRWGDISVEVNATGQKYLTLNERATKTRQGDDCHDVVGPIQVFEDRNEDRCPVNIFEEYSSKRPSEACKDGYDFYLQPKEYASDKAMQKDSVWFKKQPHGINSIKNYMTNICEKAGFSADVRRGLSNISSRKHLVTACRRAGVPDGITMKISGHKRLESLNKYADLQEEEMLAIGDVMGNASGSVSYNTALQNNSSSSISHRSSTVTNSKQSTDMAGLGNTIFSNCTIENVTVQPGKM